MRELIGCSHPQARSGASRDLRRAAKHRPQTGSGLRPKAIQKNAAPALQNLGAMHASPL
ncbi:hypothetical protein LA76x_3628 [Lysobacter antibioticus]|uniref:Uncharacterized protein n=1 Tax=Lysobacter antibioticus TaxID=84531 RepID=A0A0S2FE00_LYSAN|nr:hypothetical protein LA76x_3628 [Lysobacter antibioticus]